LALDEMGRLNNATLRPLCLDGKETQYWFWVLFRIYRSALHTALVATPRAVTQAAVPVGCMQLGLSANHLCSVPHYIRTISVCRSIINEQPNRNEFPVSSNKRFPVRN
jgi:hypothetical protein